MKIKKYFTLIVGLILPGAGHIISGHIAIGLCLFISYILYVLGMSYLVAVNSLFAVISVLFSIGISIFSAVSAYKYLTKMSNVKALTRVLLVICMIIVYSKADGFRRVVFLDQTSDLSDGRTKAGDAFAVERWDVSYAIGDIVVVKDADFEVTRRVVEIKESSVVIARGDNADSYSTEVEKSYIKGKVIFVFLSREPGTLKFRFERFLMPI